MKTKTLVEALLLINKHKKEGTFTSDEAMKMSIVFTNTYEEEKSNGTNNKVS